MVTLHHFDIQHARQYGVDLAIVINHFQFWIATNKANGKHEYDGRTWVRNSREAMTAFYPYWTEKQIRRILESLVSVGVLLADIRNNAPYDRTLSYAFAEESAFLGEFAHLPKRANGDAETGKWKSPNGQMEMPKRANVYTDNNTNNRDNNRDNNNHGAPPMEGDNNALGTPLAAPPIANGVCTPDDTDEPLQEEDADDAPAANAADQRKRQREQDLAESAARIWRAYPKKLDEREGLKEITAAIKRLARARKLTEKEAALYILNKTKAYATSVKHVTPQHTDFRYIPTAKRFYGNDRYDADIIRTGSTVNVAPDYSTNQNRF